VLGLISCVVQDPAGRLDRFEVSAARWLRRHGRKRLARLFAT
jgi:hypothetical protein